MAFPAFTPMIEPAVIVEAPVNPKDKNCGLSLALESPHIGNDFPRAKAYAHSTRIDPNDLDL